MSKTAQNETVLELSPEQIQAVELLLAGETVTGAAEAVGVSRGTLYRWMKDPAFQAALNRGKAALWEAADARVLALVDRALEVVARAVENGDVKAALRILDRTGVLEVKRPRVSDEDPELIRMGQERDAALLRLIDSL